jgi:hypothetical protein
VLFTALDGELIRKCALQASGSAGVSQQEDKLWHQMVSKFKETSANLCTSVASLARRLATGAVDPKPLEALLANRGVALDKNPGLRPIGVGGMLRRILGKAIMHVTLPDVQRARRIAPTLYRSPCGGRGRSTRNAKVSRRCRE